MSQIYCRIDYRSYDIVAFVDDTTRPIGRISWLPTLEAFGLSHMGAAAANSASHILQLVNSEPS